MKLNFNKSLSIATASALLFLWGLGSAPLFCATDDAKGFFPISVWYAGSKARAPILEKVTADSRRLWKKDLEQIKGLGFNAVRCWVDWTACEPEEGQYDFINRGTQYLFLRRNP